MNHRSLFIISVVVLFVNYTWGQSDRYKGSFPVHNYTNDDFNSPIQIFSGLQADRGAYLFGNPEKILRFDGVNWSFVELYDKQNLLGGKKEDDKKVYKIFKSSTDEIYVSRENTLATIQYDTLGKLVYVPFYYNEELSKIWSITEAPNKDVFFFASDRILKLQPDSGELSEIPLPEKLQAGEIVICTPNERGVFISVTYTTNELLSDKYGRGALFYLNYNDYNIEELNFPYSDFAPNVRRSFIFNNIEYVLDGKAGIIPVHFKNGKYTLAEKEDHMFKDMEKSLNDAIVFKDFLWLATEKRGILIVDNKGEIVREFGELEGLQDLFVFSMFFDNNDNLWLMLDNGISVVEFSSPVSSWGRSEGVLGSIESLEIYDGNIYLSSRTNGVLKSYRRDNRKVFKDDRALDEAAFDIEIVKTDFGTRKLVVGYTGIYELIDDDKSSVSIAEDVYAWTLMQSPNNRNEIFVGGEDFLGKLTISETGWDYEVVKRVSEIISFTENDGDVYFSAKGEGVYRLSKNNEFTLIKLIEEVDKQSHFYLANFNGVIYAGYKKGFLRVNPNGLDYARVKNRKFHGEKVNVHRLFKHPNKDELWAVVFIDEGEGERKEIGYFTKDSDGDLVWNRMHNPILERGVLYDIKYHEELLYFASTKGLLTLDRSRVEAVNKPWQVYLNSIIVMDSLATYIPEESNGLSPILYGQPIRFNFSNNSFFNNGEVYYRTRLIGYTDEWSTYELVNWKDYPKLPYGTYTLQVQGKNFYSVESDVYSFTFTVMPPWYFTWWAFTSYIVIIILSIIISSKIAIYRVKQKNKRLEELVRLRTNEISAQNEKLEQQKNEIQSKTEDILDSIKYAKRIQDTILPTKDSLNAMLNEHFVFYRPKDIVSGDFYWARKIGNKAIWSAVDCTGHGVPGALVSIVGNNGLLRATSEFGLTEPAKILDKTRELVVESFKNQGENDVRDGMDMALVALDMEAMTLEFAGANNGCVIIRDNEIIDIKGDKQPIGDFDQAKPFTNHVIELQKNDCIYLYSDGYVDQFGGDKGKKFKSRAFKDLLAVISQKPMEDQLDIIVKTFDDWKAGYEQIDDVCVFGVRI